MVKNAYKMCHTTLLFVLLYAIMFFNHSFSVGQGRHFNHLHLSYLFFTPPALIHSLRVSPIKPTPSAQNCTPQRHHLVGLQRVIRSAERLIGGPLPSFKSLHDSRAVRWGGGRSRQNSYHRGHDLLSSSSFWKKVAAD